MIKISNSDYFLPTIEALEAGKVLSSGRTKPTIVRGVSTQTGIKSEYVVKFKASEHLWQGSNMNELLASFIAIELDFLLPEPVVVNVSVDFVETLKDRHENFNLASKSIGFNFGSELQNGFQEIVLGQPLNEDLIMKFRNLFALDVFLGNPDRRVNRPNFLTNGKDLLIFDHELAFSFTQLFSFARNPQPWIILESDEKWLSENYAFNVLKGMDINFTDFTDRLTAINNNFWNKAFELVPDEWQNEHGSVIESYLSQIVDNKDLFAAELNRVLL